MVDVLDESQVTYRVPAGLITRVNGVYNDGGTTYKLNIALTGGVQCDKLPVIFLKYIPAALVCGLKSVRTYINHLGSSMNML